MVLMLLVRQSLAMEASPLPAGLFAKTDTLYKSPVVKLQTSEPGKELLTSMFAKANNPLLTVVSYVELDLEASHVREKQESLNAMHTKLPTFGGTKMRTVI